jgi:hypothetical protein
MTITNPHIINFSDTFSVTSNKRTADVALLSSWLTPDELLKKIIGEGFYGDGSDLDVTLSENTTLARDMFYNNLTVPLAYTLNVADFRVFVKGTLTHFGNINCNGNNGNIGSNGVATDEGAGGTGGAATATGSMPNGSAGKNGDYTKVNIDAPTVNNALIAKSYAGAKGGEGGAGFGPPFAAIDGGSAGTVNLLSPNYGKHPNFIEGVLGRVFTDSGVLKYNISGINAGSGSGGIGGGTAYGGGGGGASGSGGNAGTVFIAAYIIVGTGTISANGGNGGLIAGTGATGVLSGTGIKSPGGGGGGAGGQGGNGGLVFIISNDLSGFTGFIYAKGGNGALGGTGGAGSPGSWHGSPFFQVGDGGDGGGGGGGGNGGAGGMIIVYTLLAIAFTYSVNDGNGGIGGPGGVGGTGQGGVHNGNLYANNGNGGNGGKGGNGFIAGAGGAGAISPPTDEIALNHHGADGTNGAVGTSTGLSGTYIQIQL